MWNGKPPPHFGRPSHFKSKINPWQEEKKTGQKKEKCIRRSDRSIPNRHAERQSTEYTDNLLLLQLRSGHKWNWRSDRRKINDGPSFSRCELYQVFHVKSFATLFYFLRFLTHRVRPKFYNVSFRTNHAVMELAWSGLQTYRWKLHLHSSNHSIIVGSIENWSGFCEHGRSLTHFAVLPSHRTFDSSSCTRPNYPSIDSAIHSFLSRAT